MKEESQLLYVACAFRSYDILEWMLQCTEVDDVESWVLYYLMRDKNYACIPQLIERFPYEDDMLLHIMSVAVEDRVRPVVEAIYEKSGNRILLGYIKQQLPEPIPLLQAHRELSLSTLKGLKEVAVSPDLKDYLSHRIEDYDIYPCNSYPAFD